MQVATAGQRGAAHCRAVGARCAQWQGRAGPSLQLRNRSVRKAGQTAKRELKLLAQATPDAELDSELELSEQEKKKMKADALREAEKFMVVGEGDASCSKCGYEYLMLKGDKDFPIPAGTAFEELPDDYQCPLCGAEKGNFKSSQKEVAGFAVNQGYGFGGNTMTAGQKQLVIWGSFALFFLLFLSGYLLT